jgi:hypothetical protein
VTFDGIEIAMKIRKKFSAKKRSGKNLERIFIANSMMLGTRMRVDILKAMAK